MNKRAFEAVRDFVKAALEMTKKKSNLLQAPDFTELVVVFTDEDEGWKLESKPEYWRFIARQDKEISEMPEAINALNVLNKEGILKTSDKKDFSEIKNVLLDYLEKNRSFEFRQQEIKKSYKQYEVIWSQDKFACRLSVPLFGFKSDVDEINLPNGFVIKRLTSEEKNRLSPGFPRHITFISVPELAECNFVLVSNFQSEHKIAQIPSELAIMAGKCITALRLLNPGKFGAAGIFARSIYDCVGYHGIMAFSLDDFRLPARRMLFTAKGYHFKVEMVESLLKITGSLADPQNQKQLNRLDLGLRRFNLAYSREWPEDRLLI